MPYNSALLFALPADRPNELAAARLRFALAQEEYDAAKDAEDEFGDPVPFRVSVELENARACLGLIERQVIGEMR